MTSFQVLSWKIGLQDCHQSELDPLTDPTLTCPHGLRFARLTRWIAKDEIIMNYSRFSVVSFPHVQGIMGYMHTSGCPVRAYFSAIGQILA